MSARSRAGGTGETALLHYFVKSVPEYNEHLVFVESSKGGNDSALIAAFNSAQAAMEYADRQNRLDKLLGD